MTTNAQTTAVQTNANPFPGLRPFDANENHLFFGRDGQSDEILTSLRRNRFVSVVGTSGSGKSSLIRAGLMPLLHGGFMAQTSSSWRIALFRPGSDPIGNMAQALNRPDVLRIDSGDVETNTLITETTLRRSGLGLIEAVRQARMPAKTNLLIVVDQFEELFRFKGSGTSESAGDDAAFVKLLIEATAQIQLPIYVVITMRSDFIGDCARFRELPETINRGLYLIPLMTRDQRREAITGPAAVAGTEIAPRLINRVLNDAGESPEQLPLLQHALMRTWEHWQSSHNGAGLIDLESYESVGGMEDALSRHADEAFDQLSKRNQEIAEKVFKALAEKGPDNREVRRPTKVTELAAIADATEAEVIAVIEAFRQAGRSFLMPPPEVKLNSQSLIDVSHESLIRGWRRLREWVEEEALSAAIYRRVAETAVLYEKGDAGLWHDPDLQVALGWQDKVDPNAAWGRRYHPAFPAAMNFLAHSVAARDQELVRKERQRVNELRRTRIFAVVLAVLLMMASALGVWAMTQTRRANREADNAKKEKQNALAARDDAERAKAEAVKAKEEAETKRQEAETNKRIADQKTVEAEASLIAANAAERKASENAKRFQAAAKEAQRQTGIAEERNKLFHAAVVDAEEQNLNDMNMISSLTSSLIELSSPQQAFFWRTVRASALTNKRWHAEAEAELTKALEVVPENADARMSRGYMYMLTDRFPESIEDFDQIIAADRKSSLGYLNRGISQGIMGGYADASSSIEKAIETFMPGTYGSLSENQVSPTITRATGYRRISANEKDFQAALHYELANLEAFRGGDDFLKRLHEANQRHASDRANLSAINWAWLHMGKRTQDYGGWVSQGAMWEASGPKYCREAAYAYAEFQKAYKEHPDPRYRNLADFASRQAAAIPCRPADPLAKDDPQELSLEADLATDHGQYDKAEELLTKAIVAEPNNVDLLMKRTVVRNRRSKFGDSGADAEAVLGLVSDHPQALIYRALASDDNSVVEKNLRRVLQDHPTNLEALEWLSKTVEEKKPEEAIALLDQATKWRPYDDGLYYRKAKLQAKQERYSDALHSIESAIGINSYVSEYYDERASLEQELSRSPTQIARNLSDGYNVIADLQLRRGETGQALDTYARSLKLLTGVAKSPGSSDLRCDMALTIHRIARLIEEQGSSRDKTIAHLKFMFGGVKELEDVLNDEVRQLASSP